MKKLLIFISLFSFMSSFGQYNVKIRIQQPYTYRSLPSADIFIKMGNGKVLHYTSDKKGQIQVRLHGKIQILVRAKGFKDLDARFDIEKPVILTFQPEPENYTFPVRSGIYLEGLILNKNTLEPVRHARVRLILPDREWAFTVNDGYFDLNSKKFSSYWKNYCATDSITYEIQAPGYRLLRITDRIPKTFTIKPFYLIPAHVSVFSQTLSQPVESLGDFPVLSARPSSATLCNRLPSSIRVGTDCQCNSCSSVLTMSLQVYTQKGLNDEWIGSWHMESLKAGSMPYRTYGAYYVLHPIAANYDISNTTCKQVWDDDLNYHCRQAADATYGKYLETAGGAIAFSEYSAENNCLNSSGCSCGDGYAGNGSDWPCISDPVCAGHDRYGHGRGMCQWGTQRWASNQSKTYDWITDHYYNPGHYYRCGTDHPHPDFAVTNAQISLANGDPGDQIQASCTIVNATNYRTDKNLLKLYLSTDQTLDSNDTELTSSVLWPIDAQQQTDKNLSFQVPNQANGQYYILFVADPDGQMYESDENNNQQAVPFTIGTTGVGENYLVKNIVLYPNPVKNFVHFKISNNIKINNLRILDATGRQVLSLSQVPQQMDFSGLPAGIYYLLFTDANRNQAVFKLLKK